MQKEATSYDIIIAGGGGAGLSLAYQLASEPKLSHLSVLLIEKDAKTDNDRTWCFWERELPQHLESLVSHKWEKLRFTSEHFAKEFDIAPFRYYQVRGIDFYQKVAQKLGQMPNITQMRATVEEVRASRNVALVKANGQWFEGGYVFDSRFDQGFLQEKSRGRVLLLQHFKGWVVEAPRPVFDPNAAQFFDFRVPQQGEVRFIYVLPYTSTMALVEFTIFSKKLLEQAEYEETLRHYLTHHLKLESYRVLEEENGVIPMTDAVLRRQENAQVINIGTRGGMCKGSSGFAFLRMQRDSRQIVANLVEGRHPGKGRGIKWNFWLYDAIILRVMQRQGGTVAKVFSDLFRKNPIERTLKFLDEKTHFGEDLKVMWSVPTGQFIKAFFGVAFREIRLWIGGKGSSIHHPKS